MRKPPKLPANPNDPAVRFMLAEAEALALMNVALWLAQRLAHSVPGGMEIAMNIMRSEGVAESFAPFGVDYDADGNQVPALTPDHDPLPPLDQRQKIRDAAIRRIDTVLGELRRLTFELPYDPDEE